MVNYKEMIRIIKSAYPNFERMAKEDEANDTAKAWSVPGIFTLPDCVPYFNKNNLI